VTEPAGAKAFLFVATSFGSGEGSGWHRRSGSRWRATEALGEQLKNLGDASHASYEKLRSAEAADRLSLRIATIVKRLVATVDEKDRVLQTFLRKNIGSRWRDIFLTCEKARRSTTFWQARASRPLIIPARLPCRIGVAPPHVSVNGLGGCI
jgi:hypothetical protein